MKNDRYSQRMTFDSLRDNEEDSRYIMRYVCRQYIGKYVLTTFSKVVRGGFGHMNMATVRRVKAHYERWIARYTGLWRSAY